MLAIVLDLATESRHPTGSWNWRGRDTIRDRRVNVNTGETLGTWYVLAQWERSSFLCLPCLMYLWYLNSAARAFIFQTLTVISHKIPVFISFRQPGKL